MYGYVHELRPKGRDSRMNCALMFSMQDIVKLMGPNSASYIEMSDQLGTLEAGQLAEMAILDGNPLEGYRNFLCAKLIINGGEVVVDKR